MKKNGFTLIELLVVIAIIGIIISIVMVALGTSRQKGRDTEKTRAMQEIRTALQMFFADNGYYPTGSFSSSQTDLISALTPKYIASINKDIKYVSTNINGNACSSKCTSYHMAVILERIDNKVLSVDKNSTSGELDGTKDNCLSSGTASIPSLCYDIEP